MGFKEILKKDFFESDNKLILRYKSIKSILVLTILLFFSSFFFIGAWFYREFFLNYISIFYVLLSFSFVLYLFFYFKKTFLNRLSGPLLYIFSFLLILIFVVLIFPIIVEWGLVWFYNTYIVK